MNGQRYDGAPEYRRLAEAMERPAYDRRLESEQVEKVEQVGELEADAAREQQMEHGTAPPFERGASTAIAGSPASQTKHYGEGA